MKKQPFEIVYTDDIDAVATYEKNTLRIHKSIWALAPPLDQPGLEDERKAFQVFITDLLRFALVCKEGGSPAEALGFQAVYQHYKTRPHDLLILLDICTGGAYGAVDVARFAHFHVTELQIDKEYVRLLKEVKARLDAESDKSVGFPW